MMVAPPMDGFHRRIDYLRLSITDRCNLRCRYCMPSQGIPKLKHEEILRYEEIMRVAHIAVRMGMSKIRITGGEPLVRKDLLYLCENISKIPGLSSLSITTNGVLLGRFAESLFSAGIRRINISLDTLKRDKFFSITRVDCFEEVWRGILAAQKAGISPIKLNTVIMRGTNDDEIEDLARLTVDYPLHVRFIELMPFQSNESLTQSEFVSSDEILERLHAIAPLDHVPGPEGNGPASHFRLSGAQGTIGIISPISHHFCAECNRLRLTADGKLRTCLFSTEETDLRDLLRDSASDESIIQTIREAIRSKPERHTLDRAFSRKCFSRPMSTIGG